MDGVRIGTALLLGATASVGAQPTFFESANEPALLLYDMAFGMVGGAAVGDFDRDGDHDVFLANGLATPSQLLVNQGNGSFVSAVLPDTQPHNDRAGLWIDHDGDSDLDLLVFADNHRQTTATETSNLRLYENINGQLRDRTSHAGLDKLLQRADEHPDGELSHASGIAAADFDNDGAMDFYVTFWAGRNYVFMNNGDGTYRDASAMSGIQEWNTFWQPGLCDFDRDGHVDICQPVDFQSNRFFRSNGDGSFTDIAGDLGVDNAWNDMGIAISDPDNDGDLDFFITNIHDSFTPLSDLQGRHNVMYRNVSAPGTLAFVESAVDMRIAYGDWGWGCTFVDVDHDGWQDLAQTNGFDVNPARGFATDRTRMYRNNGAGVFGDIAPDAGLDDDRIGACYVAFDADGDGDQDLLQTCLFDPASLRFNRLEQTGTQNNWLRVRPRSVVPGSSGQANHFAVGAVVRVDVGDPSIGVQTRLISAGGSLLGQEPAESHFGLGIESVSADVMVEWPSGLVTTHGGVGVNQVVTVVDATRTDADLDGDGVLSPADLRMARSTPFDITGDLVYSDLDIARVAREVLWQSAYPKSE